MLFFRHYWLAAGLAAFLGIAGSINTPANASTLVLDTLSAGTYGGGVTPAGGTVSDQFTASVSGALSLVEVALSGGSGVYYSSNAATFGIYSNNGGTLGALLEQKILYIPHNSSQAIYSISGWTVSLLAGESYFLGFQSYNPYWNYGKPYISSARFAARITVDEVVTEEPAPSVPLPAALPLFATAFAGLGFMGWRRKRLTDSRAAR